jgi:hypothetical protein
MEQSKSAAEKSFLHLEELGVRPKSSLKRPIRKPLVQYRTEKGSPQQHTPNSEAQIKFDLDVMAFLVNSNLHYSFVETKGFQHFVSVTNQNYNVKSPRTMSKRIAPLLHKNLEKALQEVLEKELPDCHNVVFTFIDWERYKEEDQHDSEVVVCLCIHYINKSFEFRKITFSVDILVDPSANDFARMIDDTMKRVPCKNDS